MAKKDLSAKNLEAYNDVFADIGNALLYHGEKVISEKRLFQADTVSQYKADGKVHEQIRDIQKVWGGHAKIAMIGIENQTKTDPDMVLRVIGYDGASYRNQLNENLSGGEGRKRKKERYPVITLVLNFGNRRWNAPKSLYERLTIPEDIKPYVSDYRINVFDIAFLSEEQLKLFHSDFRIVADYFVQVRKNNGYIPSTDKMLHPDAVLQMMSALTGDKRFEEACHEERKGEFAMCEILDRIENRGIEKGIKEGIKEGIRVLVQTCVSLGTTKEVAVAKVSEGFAIPKEEAERNVEKYWKDGGSRKAP